MKTALLEVALSVGLYYLLRALGVGVSNVLSFVTIGAVILVSAVLIQPPRRIIERRSASRYDTAP